MADSFQGLIEYLHDVAMAEDNSEEAEKEEEPGLSVADEGTLHIKVSNMVMHRYGIFPQIIHCSLF